MNPASGTVKCGYDVAGNLYAKTDARGVATIYGYDALNRVASKTCNDGITLPLTYTYDDPNVANSKGRLTRVYKSTAVNYSEYDALGSVTASNEQIAGIAVT